MTFLARFPGRCGVCDEPIHEGDEVDLVDGEVAHAACAEEWHEEEQER